MTPDQIAHVCHEANRALQIEQANPTIPISKFWGFLDPEAKASMVDGVEGVLRGNTPEQSHEQWCKFKTEHAWLYGPVKDEEHKLHPLLVPYNELPPEQRLKDALFCAIVKALS